MRFPVSHRLDDFWAADILGFDIAQLAALLCLTGGLANPFSILFLAPIMTSAVVVAAAPHARPARFHARLRDGAATLALAAALAGRRGFRAAGALRRRTVDGDRRQRDLRHDLRQPRRRGGAPTRQRADRHGADPRPRATPFPARRPRRRGGARIGHAAGDRGARRSRTGGPAARSPPIAPRICVWSRSRSAAAGRSSASCPRPPTIAASSLEETTLGELIEEIAAPHRLLDVEIEVEREGPAPEPVCRRNPAMIYGLTNLVENAVELRREPGRDSRVLDRARRSRSSSPTTGRAFRRRCWRGSASPIFPTRGGARRARGRGGAAGSASACSSPRRCSSVPARLWRSPMRRRRGRARVATIVWPLAAFEHGRLSRRQALDS